MVWMKVLLINLFHDHGKPHSDCHKLSISRILSPLYHRFAYEALRSDFPSLRDHFRPCIHPNPNKMFESTLNYFTVRRSSFSKLLVNWEGHQICDFLLEPIKLVSLNSSL